MYGINFFIGFNLNFILSSKNRIIIPITSTKAPIIFIAPNSIPSTIHNTAHPTKQITNIIIDFALSLFYLACSSTPAGIGLLFFRSSLTLSSISTTSVYLRVLTTALLILKSAATWTWVVTTNLLILNHCC